MRKWLSKQTHDRPFFSALVCLLLVMVPGYLLIEQRAQEACERDNELRQAYVDQWSPILAESPPPVEPPPGSPQEAIDAYNAQIEVRTVFETGLTEGFAQHSC